MSAGRVLGLDPGTRRIGVALSDPLGMIAQPHTVLDVRRHDVIAELRRMVTELGVVLIVVGLPVTLRGEEGLAVEGARELAARIADGLGIAVEHYDERFTTVQAEAALIEGGVRRQDRRVRRDMVAAALMLQGYLDRRHAPGRPASDPEGGMRA